MPRKLLNPSAGTTIIGKLETYNGGTGATDAPTALTNLTGIPVIDKNQPNGPIGLDANGKIPDNVGVITNNPVTINGLGTVIAGVATTYTITNYDEWKTYNISATSGAINRIKDIITFRPSSIAGTVDITINNTVFTLTVQDNTIKTPVIQSPTNLSIENPLIVNIQSDTYSTIGSLEIGTLLASDGAANDFYGHGVSVSRDGLVLAVGSWGKDTVAGVDAGQVYIYDWDISTSTWIERSILLASDAAAGDVYGATTALNSTGTILAVGALGKDTVAGVDAGQVYIYDWNGTTWIERSKILASDSAASDWYGVSAALDSTGTILAVGAHGKDTVGGVDAGQVYIYDWNVSTWVERSKILASDGVANDYHGISTALNSTGTILAVGAFAKDTIAGVDAGQVYIYDWDVSTSTWIERSILLASDAAAGDQYGMSTALDSTGTILVVGAQSKDTVAGIDAGQVYIYDWNGTTWIERSILLASDAAVSDFYGRTIGLSGDAGILAVGAYGRDTIAGADAGQVYIVTPSYHVSSDWQLSTDPGFSNIVVSSLSDTTNLENWIVNNLVLNTNYYTRVRYHSLRFGTSPWSDTIEFTTKVSAIPSIEINTIRASDGAVNDYYGHGVSVSRDGLVLAVGSWGKDTVAGVDAGQVYIYDWDISTSTWIERSILLASDGAASDHYGATTALDSTGTILAVGAIGKDTVAGVDAGQVYIYDWNGTTWIERSKLLASDAAAGDGYGESTALDSTGTILAVGALGKDTVGGVDAGQVYIYDWNGTTWIERSKILASDGAASDLYGASTALDSTGTILAVGAQGKDTVAGVDAGQVYIYDWNGTTWIERNLLLASDGAASDQYGISTALNSTGTILAIGAWRKDTVAGVDAGQVYIYDWNGTTWIERSILLASDGAANDLYGRTIGLSGDAGILAVGAYAKDTIAGVDAGQVYTYV